ncbi:MAG: uncharacterized protein HW380_1924 [Magnetococcales bacterium]|nr:uncharacterized protein [Magnetococcales bacterium]HIJ83419.1 hypothetical protein [Magnetococcales bacterium]
MCSVVIHYRPDHDWPILLAANRDEMMDRPWLAPGRHWPEQKFIIAGKDQLAGGSWLGMNDWGVVAIILNRLGTLGTQPGKSSRGQLVLRVLHYKNAKDAVTQFRSLLTTQDFRPFNLIIADFLSAFWISWRVTKDEKQPTLSIQDIPPGLHMLTSRELDDRADPRIQGFLPRFLECSSPDPELDWSSWAELMKSCTPLAGAGPDSAMCFQLESRFATVSSSLIALPNPMDGKRFPAWLFAPGNPRDVAYRPVTGMTLIRPCSGNSEILC